ncbi:MAG TPA: hypothetical protein VIG79_11465 [Lapillicoccus sp.]|jgi:hypothetical protein|uniref:hypothetical protein n=1 Tax=Lapillicoccus sp. TaxID=1909287 RepID=UPI002F92F586
MCTTAPEDVAADPASKYAADVVSLNRDLSFRNLANLAQQDPARVTHYAERGDGLVTLAVKTRHLPHRYLIGLQGFRLAQYLQLGWACSDVAYRQAIFCEPLGVTHADDEHIITMSPSGRILGYVSLATNGDGESRDLFDPERAAFPVEEAHAINIFDRVAPLAGVGTHEVRELKRFVHSRTLTDRTQRLRVTLELLHGLGQAVVASSPAVRTLIGDVEEQVALRHLLMAGLEVQLVEGTTPQLTDRDLLRHAYTERASVKPFVSHLPDAGFAAQQATMLAETLDSPDLFQATTDMSASRPGRLSRVEGERRAA